jgi:hypothetical protein
VRLDLLSSSSAKAVCPFVPRLLQEAERLYVLHKARTMYDDRETYSKKEAGYEAPNYLRARLRRRQEPPKVCGGMTMMMMMMMMMMLMVIEVMVVVVVVMMMLMVMMMMTTMMIIMIPMTGEDEEDLTGADVCR